MVKQAPRFVKEVGKTAGNWELCSGVFLKACQIGPPLRTCHEPFTQQPCCARVKARLVRQRYLPDYMKHIFFSILLILAFSFCKEAEKANNHSLDVYIRFDEAAASVKAELRAMDLAAPPQAILLPGGAQYQQKAMQEMPVMGVRYQLEMSAAFTNEHVFQWKEPEGASQSLKLHMNTFQQVRFESDTLSRKKAAALRWDGPPLETNEGLVLIWENTRENRTIPMELISVNNQGKVEFPAAKINELSAGQWSMYVVRKKTVQGRSGRAQVNARLEYYTKPRLITVL